MSVLLSLVLVLLACSAAFPFEENYQAPEDKIQINTTKFTTAEDGLLSAGVSSRGGGMLQGRLKVKPTAKKISLKRSGNFFLVPISVGTPSKLFSVKLDTSSSCTFLFSGTALTGRGNGFALRRQDAAPKRRKKKRYTVYYGETESSTYTPYLNEYGKVQPFFADYAFDGSAYEGVIALDSVVVGGIKMEQTPIAIVDKRSGRSIPAQNDISGFDGVLGLGLKAVGPRYTPPIFSSMIRASRTMAKTEVFSLYICSDGHAGQLYLGSADMRNLLTKGSKLMYVPMSREHDQWAIKLDFAHFQMRAIKNRVAIIDSTSPFILAPKEDINVLFKNVNVAIHWPRAVQGTEKQAKEEGGQGTKKSTSTTPSPPRMNAPMFMCGESGNFGSLELTFVDTGGTSKPVALFTGRELLGTKVEDQTAYPGMCELLVQANLFDYETTWRLGLPFLHKVGFTVFDRKNMKLGFGPAKHSNKICGKRSTKKKNSSK